MQASRSFILTIFVSVLAACGSEVEKNYSTIAAARADQLFDKGWLPDILPDSARNINVSNNLDLNVSTGDFSFNAADWAHFEQRVTAGANPDAPFADWNSNLKRHKADGDSDWSFQDESTTWVFFCRSAKEHCEYYMWLTRKK